MQSERTIGRAVKVKTYQALVELLPETSSYVKSSLGGLYAIAVINSFVVIPVGSERVVAVVTGLDMAEEPEASVQNRQMLVIARPRRTMWVTMTGTITQDAAGRKRFEYGVRRYPELDNPVWFASEEDLDVIFQKSDDDGGKHRVTIGVSPLFTGYRVAIDIDRFFGKHAAILGNTGSGKSCTVTAIIRAVLDHPGGMPNAHFVIFDTNNEYERAFTRADGAPMYNRLICRNQGDVPDGLWVPHWFMNTSDYQAFFRPGEGAQAPLLFKAIGVARSRERASGELFRVLTALEDSCSRIDGLLSAVGNAAYFAKKNLRTEVQACTAMLSERSDAFGAGTRGAQWYASEVQGFLDALPPGDGAVGADLDVRIRDGLERVRTSVARDRSVALERSGPNPGVDSPVHFDFDDFVERVFPEELQREAQKDPRLRSYVGTLQLRLEQARHDPRYAFLFDAEPWQFALASFLRFLLGAEPAKHFATAPPPWADDYRRQYKEPRDVHNLTIIDLSQLAADVLENVTALIGRLILEFMQRIPGRGSFPVVLVLEEAHHYIPAHATSERQQRAREVFERIAKEGRKFGLSLLVASQRPSELSRTVLAQCNSFIVHRIQNPDDQEYFKSVISGIDRDLLEQLPALAQQRAIVLGDCVPLPLQVSINTVSPRPHSPDPEFFGRWSASTPAHPDFEKITTAWEGGQAEPPDPSGQPKTTA